ncbi:MAG: RNA polymerase sigma factor [Planctomycetaceae bacterium]|jgi:RNA polymerase sigma-70 factor (ECF subfamily)|nr:RNA polymerase sigma factor [Planctomycetaceae bacterium]
MFRNTNETTNPTATVAIGSAWSHWTDEELFLEYRCTGIREAFEEIVHRYERELYNYLYRYLGNSANAEDVFQKTFLMILEKSGKFDADRKFRPWLYSVAANIAIDHLRRAKRYSVISMDESRGNDDTCTIADMVEGNEPEPFEEPMDREIAGKVREAVDALPEQMRQAVYMVYFQGMTCRAAADAVGIHYNALSLRLKHAVQKLNFLLKNVG